MEEITDEQFERGMRLREAWMTECAIRIGFDQTEDHAALIARFFSAMRNQYSRDRHDPVLGPIIRQAIARYDQTRNVDFEIAERASYVEGVRAILRLTLPTE